MLFKERRRLCLSALFMYIRFVSDFVTQSSWQPAQPRTILLNNLWSSLNLFQIQYPSLLVEDDVQERNVPRLAEAEARAEPWRRGGGRQDVLQSQFPDHHDSTALHLQLQHGVQQEPGLGLLAAGHDVKSSSCSPHTRGSSQTPRDQPSLQIQVRAIPVNLSSELVLSHQRAQPGPALQQVRACPARRGHLQRASVQQGVWLRHHGQRKGRWVRHGPSPELHCGWSSHLHQPRYSQGVHQGGRGQPRTGWDEAEPGREGGDETEGGTRLRNATGLHVKSSQCFENDKKNVNCKVCPTHNPSPVIDTIQLQ